MWKKMVCASLLVCMLGWIHAGAAVKPAGWWKLDDGTGDVAVDSVGTTNGSLLNRPSWVTGQVGGALRFDGVDDCVDLGTSSIVSPAGSFTVTLWVSIAAWGTE